MRRDREEPVGPVVGLDMPELEVDLLLAEYDRRALHPRAGLEADEHVFGHGVLREFSEKDSHDRMRAGRG